MTTEELLWNATFENVNNIDESYDYKEESAIERYHEDKELHERFTEYFKQAS